MIHGAKLSSSKVNRKFQLGHHHGVLLTKRPRWIGQLDDDQAIAHSKVNNRSESKAKPLNTHLKELIALEERIYWSGMPFDIAHEPTNEKSRFRPWTERETRDQHVKSWRGFDDCPNVKVGCRLPDKEWNGAVKWETFFTHLADRLSVFFFKCTVYK